MPGFTHNSIVVLRDFSTVFDLTNRIDLWPQLFTEYRAAEILERNGDELLFRLTTFPEGERPSRSWTSRRWIDRANRRATAERLAPAFPFASMRITWTYEPLPQDVGVVMTWMQEFEVHPDAKFSNEQMESFLNRNTRAQMQAVKAAVERWEEVAS